ncbi:MAG: transcriptional regulator [Gammaproteobacteria bacterium]|nr:transcriptional regulator [Gammaproteobacteria bacterium]
MYHYTECGLINIYLKNGVEIIETPYGSASHIENIEELHKVIGADIVCNKPTLNPSEFRFLRKELNMTQKTIGDIVGKEAQTVAKWEKGDVPVPKSVCVIIRKLYLEYIGDNKPLQELVEHINHLDILINGDETRTFEETEDGWKADAA